MDVEGAKRTSVGMLARTSHEGAGISGWLWSRATLETGLIVTVLLAEFLLLPHAISADGLRRYNELKAILQDGRIPSDKYSVIGPLFSAPLWYLGHLIGGVEWWLSRYNVILFGLGLAAMYAILKDRVDRGLLRTFFLILAVASLFPVALGDYYGEAFTALAVGIGILAAVFGPALVGWVAAALGVANTPATLLGLGFAAGVRVLQRKRWRPLLVVIAALGLIILEDLIRHGNIFNTSYEPGFDFPILLGVLSILFSFGKGLIFFTPGLLLPVRARLLNTADAALRKLYETHTLWLWLVAGMVLVYAHWYDWSGDWYWGPRFFLIAALPASLALAIYLRHPSTSLPANLAVLGILCLSAWGGINSVVFSLTAMVPTCNDMGPLAGNCPYLPQSSALWFPLLSPHLIGKRELLYGVLALVVFGYLAAPLALTITRQSWTLLRQTAAEFSVAWRGSGTR